MHTVSIFTNGKNQAIRIPKEMEFDGVKELIISKEAGYITLRPKRPDWLSFQEVASAADDFLTNRTDVVSDEGHFEW